MKKSYLILIAALILTSCSTKKQLIYIKDANKVPASLIDSNFSKNIIESGDILKIDIQTIVPEAAIPYNKIRVNTFNNQNIQTLQLEGYLVNKEGMIKFPVLGALHVSGLTLDQIEKKISQLLLDGGHLTNPSVKARRVNSKFTVLGEVRNPGTFSYFDETLNLFQALGYAGDLTIDAKRKNITLVREENGVRVLYKISLTKSDLLTKPYYYIKNNDVIIIEPNFSKVKSAGFIGSPSSIASISSLLLSITLLIINR